MREVWGASETKEQAMTNQIAGLKAQLSAHRKLLVDVRDSGCAIDIWKRDGVCLSQRIEALVGVFEPAKLGDSHEQA
jgi:hypothetical protein